MIQNLFQFTPLHERQHYTPAKKTYKVCISIHASTWEAATPIHLWLQFLLFQFTPLHERQPFQSTQTVCCLYFNSRLYMRGSARHQWQTKLINQFQFTPLHERQRLKCRSHAISNIYFNSRLYMRGSSYSETKDMHKAKFQFTPLHERQPKLNDESGIYILFQFTPLHERQPEAPKLSDFKLSISIHASTWEAA